MDKSIYVAMNGAKATFDRVARISNNLANANTSGFRAEMMSTKALYVQADQGMPTRVFSTEAPAGFKTDSGALNHTGNPLDVAIKGQGWFAVQAGSGEGYTRAGDLVVSADGTLSTAAGKPVLGDGGPIQIPQGASAISFGEDGTLSVQQNKVWQPVGKLKLVNPDPKTMTRGEDGFFRMANGQAASVDERVRIVPGAVESSNVSVIEEMTRMIEAQRRLDVQTQLMQKMDQDGGKASQILNLG